LPELFAGLRLHLCSREAWPPDAPRCAVAVFIPPSFLAVRAVQAPAAFFVASLAHEALHSVQWAEAGRPEAWCASAVEEGEAEEFGQAMAARFTGGAPCRE
jgi:hypothetical protein